MIYRLQIEAAYPAGDHSTATQQATELGSLLAQAGYEAVAVTLLDEDGELVAEFGVA